MLIETVEAGPRAGLESACAGTLQAAKAALWEAVDYPTDRATLIEADKAFRAALEAEGWLDDTTARPPS
jgi:hypothetical protein